MMQMLAAGGVPILSDGERRADVDNPRGCLEWERIKQLPKDPNCIGQPEGKAVKVISQLLLSLPRDTSTAYLHATSPAGSDGIAGRDAAAAPEQSIPGEDNSVVARAGQSPVRMYTP